MARSFPLSVHTTYQDLLQAHAVRAISDIPGKPFLRDMGEKGKYWYARQRIGDKTIQKYIGPDTPEIRERIEAAQAANEEAQAFGLPAWRHAGRHTCVQALWRRAWRALR